MSDASFKEGREAPLRLIARDEGDLSIVSTMVQDAIAERKEMLFEADKRCFSLLLKRFRWEDSEDAQHQTRDFERVQSVLMVQSATAVKFRGFDNSELDLAFDLIGVSFQNNAIILSFSGNGEIAISTECIDVLLTDVSRPYKAKSQILPHHQE